MKKFNGRVFLFTGTLSGIGKQVAIDFANSGERAVRSCTVCKKFAGQQILLGWKLRFPFILRRLFG
jgi:NAD(P)-dependent dehydrogenase (short-subunit alcohol dehydrogenase family)